MEDEHLTRRYVERGSWTGKSIAVLTSGGDSQGMNCALRAIVRMGYFLGCKMYLVYEGYNGLVNGNIKLAKWTSVSGIIHKGGTIIGSSRSDEFRKETGRRRATFILLKRKISHLIVIGGDGSLTGADAFQREWPNNCKNLLESGEVTADEYECCKDLYICGLVGSIDNDFYGTDLTIGTYSALQRIQEATDAIASTAASHQRIFILEVMGRQCGYLALVCGLTCEADYIFIPEMPAPDNWKEELSQKILQERSNGKRLNIIIVSEGATDRQGNKIKANDVKDAVINSVRADTRVSILGHIQRGGRPCAIDRSIAARMGAEASLAVLERRQCVIAIDGNVILRRNLMECVKQTHAVYEALKNKQWDVALKLRGVGFIRAFKMYQVLSRRPPSEDTLKRNLAIIHLGTPTNGMNAVVYSFVRTALLSGYIPWGIRDSIQGLLRGEVKRLHWNDVNGWVSEGGSKFGSKHSLPNERLSRMAIKFKEYDFQGFLIVGGFVAYMAALQIYEARKQYPEFCIPICVIPATINNNIPGTEFCLGCDTALNEIIDCCDTLRLAASGTKRRVYIIETMGGYCGYLALMGALCSGADEAFLAEEPFDINDLLQTCYHIGSKMSTGIQRGLIIRNEYCNPNYTTEFIKNLFEQEGFGLFTVKTNIIAHVQQGGSPSPFDRDFGIKLGTKAVEWFIGEINRNLRPDAKVFVDTCESAVLIGIVRRHFYFTPLQILKTITNFEKQIPQYQWWLRLNELVKIVATHENENYKEGIYISLKDS